MRGMWRHILEVEIIAEEALDLYSAASYCQGFHL